jgi:hypothetical protein
MKCSEVSKIVLVDKPFEKICRPFGNESVIELQIRKYSLSG